MYAYLGQYFCSDVQKTACKQQKVGHRTDQRCRLYYAVRASRFAQALDLARLFTNIGAGVHCSSYNVNDSAAALTLKSTQHGLLLFLWKSLFGTLLRSSLSACTLQLNSRQQSVGQTNIMRESMATRGCVIFVGNLPGDVREREVEDLFVKVRHAL